MPTCTAKVRFETQELASRHLLQNRHRLKRPGALHVYHCEYHGAWHIGRDTGPWHWTPDAATLAIGILQRNRHACVDAYAKDQNDKALCQGVRALSRTIRYLQESMRRCP
jgi:hypothetical protein